MTHEISTRDALAAHYAEVAARLRGPVSVRRYRRPKVERDWLLIASSIDSSPIPHGIGAGRDLLHKILAERGVSLVDLLSERRNRYLVAVRHEVMWRLRRETSMSMPEIGRLMGRDHTSVLNGIRAHEQRMKLIGGGP